MADFSEGSFGLNSFDAASDEELISLAQNGSGGALDFLLKKHSELVKKIANRYFLVGADHDDLVQEGMIGLFKAVRSYENDKNASFRSFAELCITRNILTAIKSATRQKHKPLNSYVSLDRPVYGNGDEETTLMDVIDRSETVNPEDILLSQERIDVLEKRLARFLSDMECKVLLYYLRGEDYGDIAGKLGTDRKAVDNALQRIRRKFEKIVSDDEGADD